MHKILSSLACALVACAPLAASANNGEIRFEGRINNATCKVDGGGTVLFFELLDSLRVVALLLAQFLHRLGALAGRAFHLPLHACDVALERLQLVDRCANRGHGRPPRRGPTESGP